MDEILSDVYLAPAGWHYNDNHPETGTQFDEGWAGLYLTSTDDGQYWNGTSISRLFTVSFNRCVVGLEQRVADLILYTQGNGKKLIIGTDRNMIVRQYVYESLASAASSKAFRPTDPRYVVHSTSEESWQSIQSDMKLKSPRVLFEEGMPCTPVGKTLLGDPEDFERYIHLAAYDSMHTEFVVMSRQRLCMMCDSLATYKPGVRIYLDNRKLIEYGKVERDGLHTSKVKGVIDLNRYMVLYVTGYDLPGEWTPKRFSAYATHLFDKEMGIERK